MGDIIYYSSGIATLLGIPALIILTIFLMIKPHVINNRRKTPLRRKHILAIGLVSVLVAFIGFGSVMAATEPASVRASIMTQQAADEKAAQILNLKQQQETIDAAKPVVKSITSTESIAFDSTNQNDNSLPNGQTQVSTKGVNGIRTITYDVTYINGKETSRKQASRIITTPPINKVTLVGTYVTPATPTPTATITPTTTTNTSTPSCTNGTYINSAGNTVCSPETSSTVPSGATAKCNDGTYSFSQSRSGTCSHHGGVGSWL